MADVRVDRINEAASVLKEALQGRRPVVGIVLGSGLGDLADRIEEQIVVPYTSLPGFPATTAIGHKGNFICGFLGGKCVLAMQGRFHYYEGHPMETVTLPIRVMAVVGIEVLLVSNAVGCMNQQFYIGDLMLIRDHINLQPNPLVGRNLEQYGVRFPDMTCAYDVDLRQKMKEIALREHIHIREGVLISCTGPTYETPAEYYFFRMVGADVVGMSTTPEVIVARHMGLRVLGMSVVTDKAHAVGDDYVTDGEEIVRIAAEAAKRMCRLFTRLIEEI